MNKKIVDIMPLRFRKMVKEVLTDQKDAEEIRIRIGQPLEICCKEKSIWIGDKIRTEDLEELLLFISEYSLYAYEEEVRQGFLTIEGGSRIGFAGQVRLEDGKILRMTNIRFLNIRIAKEKKGCAKELLPFVCKEGEICNTLLISKPGVGKTTYLRDLIRLISDGEVLKMPQKVCVIDERSEIAACHLGIPQNDVGRRTDVIDGCMKTEGMLMALRSMSPQVIAVDELGGNTEYQMAEYMIYSGCKVIGTMHGNTPLDFQKKQLNPVFERYIWLQRKADGERCFSVFDEHLLQLC